jgi:Ca-activated chloride channel family protein
MTIAAGCTAGGARPQPTEMVTGAGGPGCPQQNGSPERMSGDLAILAGSELKDLDEEHDAAGKSIVDYIRDETGISVRFTYSGTLDAVAQMVDGDGAKHYDAVWLPSNQYLTVYLDAHPRPGLFGTSIPVMSSPVILGVRPEKAGALQADPSWAGFTDLAAKGEIGFAMTNPAASNSGYSALVAAATALRATSGPIGAADVSAVAPRLRQLFAAQELTAGSSGWLKDAYVRRATDGTPIDVLINYESVLLELNRAAQPSDQLSLVYPRDGVVTANYPLTPVTSRGGDAMRRFQSVLTALCGQHIQGLLESMTHRRPSSAGVALTDEFPPLPPELTPPTQLAVADSLIHAFGNSIRRPARTIYVLDLSGSMERNVDAVDPTRPDDPNAPKIKRIDALRLALLSLTGADNSLPAQFTVFHEREQVILLPFNDAPHDPQRFEVPADAPQAELDRIGQAVKSLSATGNTALYDALVRAYEIAAEPTVDDRYTTIVLLSDGERTVGREMADFRRYYEQLPVQLRAVPVFSVLLGDGNRAELTALSRDITGGEFFDGNSGKSLAQVFQDIRGYQ